jgi:hypothetical protein
VDYFLDATQEQTSRIYFVANHCQPDNFGRLRHTNRVRLEQPHLSLPDDEWAGFIKP